MSKANQTKSLQVDTIHQLPPPQKRRVRPAACSALALSLGLMSTALATLALFAVRQVSPPEKLPPAVVIDSPPPPETSQEHPRNPLLRPRTPPPPQAVTPPKPTLPDSPPPQAPAASPSSLALSSQALDTIALLQQLEKEEAARLQQLRDEERLAEERRKRAEEEEKARLAKLAAERRAREAEIAAAERRERQRQLALQKSRQKNSPRPPSLGKKIASIPKPIRKPVRYPSSARRAGLQGTARVSATITASGRVQAPRLLSSSGHSILDSAALSAVKNWRFEPARNALGEAVAYQLTIPVTFRIN